jgi:xanthine dehydrogenase YagS FAD-binding subunit
VRAFSYAKPADLDGAIVASTGPDVKFVAGGTTLIDLMKLDVETPSALVDINGLALDRIERADDGGLSIGALVRNSDLAHHPDVVQSYPALSQALLSGASPQLRNMATTGGNLLQRTRCPYFRDVSYACNKRQPGSGCAAQGGFNRSHAILGISPQCIATHPSDMAVALLALGADVHLRGAGGERSVPLGEFYLLPGATPERETVLLPGELVTHVTLPPTDRWTRSQYVKRRDRAAYEFALASAAVVVRAQTDRLERVRIVLGGVATRPWRVPDAERSLEGSVASDDAFRGAADIALRGAQPRDDNRFKVELAKRTMIRALQLAVGT